jgi:5-methylcytosine-specific restriction endonuclease McrA
MTSCEWCRMVFRPRSHTQRFCSKSCATHSRYPNGPQRVTRWGPRPPLDPDHRRLRAQLAPRAIGQPCPLCGAAMREGSMQLDHIIPRSQGGQSTPDNVRMICQACNQRRGAQLGGRRSQPRRGRQPTQATATQPRQTVWVSRRW